MTWGAGPKARESIERLCLRKYGGAEEETICQPFMSDKEINITVVTCLVSVVNEHSYTDKMLYENFVSLVESQFMFPE